MTVNRNISPEMQAHLDSGETTLTLIMRIVPQLPGFDAVGCTMLDKDVIYDDSRGELTYHGVIGMTPSTMQAVSGMGVDNAEAQHLIPLVDLGIDEHVLNSGAYDYADFWLMAVNYEDLSMGHIPLMQGQLGQVRVQDGLTFWTEQTSLSKQLKVPIVAQSSRTCRARFGSQPVGTEGAEFTERQPCGKNFTWLSGTVGAVGLETNLTFTASSWSAPAGTFVPGVLLWTAGANAGRQSDVKSQGADGAITLREETMFPIQEDDEFDIRADCTKWWDGSNGCRFHWGDEWIRHYRGEPYLKPQDSDGAITPGAGI